MVVAEPREGGKDNIAVRMPPKDEAMTSSWSTAEAEFETPAAVAIEEDRVVVRLGS